MQYLLLATLTIFSYLFGTYFAYQGLRNKRDRPLLYRSDIFVFLLTVLLGWVPFVVAMYLAYRYFGSFVVLMILIIRFVITPTLFNDKLKSFMDRNGF